MISLFITYRILLFQKKDSRIFIGLFYTDVAIKVFCEVGVCRRTWWRNCNKSFKNKARSNWLMDAFGEVGSTYNNLKAHWHNSLDQNEDHQFQAPSALHQYFRGARWTSDLFCMIEIVRSVTSNSWRHEWRQDYFKSIFLREFQN